MPEPLIAHTRLWETAAGRLVEDGDEGAAFLVAGEGATIDPGTAARLGLSAKGGKIVQKEGEEAEDEPDDEPAAKRKGKG